MKIRSTNDGLSEQVSSLTFWSMKLLKQRNANVSLQWIWHQKQREFCWLETICRFAYWLALFLHFVQF